MSCLTCFPHPRGTSLDSHCTAENYHFRIKSATNSFSKRSVFRVLKNQNLSFSFPAFPGFLSQKPNKQSRKRNSTAVVLHFVAAAQEHDNLNEYFPLPNFSNLKIWLRKQMYITVIRVSKNIDLCIFQLVNLKGTHQNGIKDIPIKK